MLKISQVERVQEDGGVQLPAEAMARSGIGPNDSIIMLVTSDGEIVLQKCANRETDGAEVDLELAEAPGVAEQDESYGSKGCAKNG